MGIGWWERKVCLHMASSINRYFVLVLATGERVLFWTVRVELDDKVSCAVFFAFIGSDCHFMCLLMELKVYVHGLFT